MFETVSNLHKLCFPHKPWGAADFSDLKKSGCEIIASDHGFVVWRVVADEAEIITVGVHPEYRGTGIAIAMLTIAEVEIAKTNAKKIFLEVAEDNVPARKLYEKQGYTQVGKRPKYYDGIDAIIMEKSL